MSGDKRVVTTDALETLGTIHAALQKRDAIHLAVEPVIAGERLRPGDHINVMDGTAYAADVGAGLGIVDPFLKAPVKRGERFWFVMYPGMVHSLRHVWTHPAFTDEPVVGIPGDVIDAKATSMAWIQDFADECGMSARAMIDAAREHLHGGDYHIIGNDTPSRVYDDNDKFWEHYEIVTGEKVPSDKRETFISCSC